MDCHGAFYTAQAAARMMRRFNTHGSIILIASIAGSVQIQVRMQHGWRVTTVLDYKNSQGHQVIAYNAAKSAVLQIARTMACELGGEFIRVNTISPGYTNTTWVVAFPL